MTHTDAHASRPATGQIPWLYPWLFLIGATAVIGYYWLENPAERPTEVLSLATLTVAAACLPMFCFLLKGKTFQIPVLELFCVFLAISFGFAGFLRIPHIAGAQRITLDDDAMAEALKCTLLGIVCLLAGYYGAGKSLKGMRPWGHSGASGGRDRSP